MLELTAQAKQIIDGVDARFFLVQSDGSIQTRNARNKLQQFAFQRIGSAQAHARRYSAVVYDKTAAQFV